LCHVTHADERYVDYHPNGQVAVLIQSAVRISSVLLVVLVENVQLTIHTTNQIQESVVRELYFVFRRPDVADSAPSMAIRQESRMPTNFADQDCRSAVIIALFLSG
jgi:hypothetical protein